MTRADTIARHLNQAGEHLKTAACPGNPQVYATSGPALSIDAAMRCINAAFLECLGGAAVAGEAARIAVQGGGGGAAFVDCTAAPEPPKPAGWVVRHSSGVVRWLCIRTREGGWPKHEPFATRENAQRIADTTGGEVVPVDAAGNVIEAEDISATLRREECERKAARQAGEEREWEAMRADRDAFKAEAERLRGEIDVTLTECANLRLALRDIAPLVGCGVDPSAVTETHCAVAGVAKLVVEGLRRDLAAARDCGQDGVCKHSGCQRHWQDRNRELVHDLRSARTELAAVKAERDALAAEVQRAREQKPARWMMIGPDGKHFGTTNAPTLCAEDTAKGWTVAPLYLAPVVRDHSGVIAQCEEALKEWDSKGAHCSATSSLVAVTLTKARNALRGAS